MDINELYTAPKHEAGAEMQIKHPVTGKLTEFYIKFVGVDSRRFREIKRNNARRRMEEVATNKDALDSAFLWIAESVISWRGFNDADGAELECTVENANNLFDQSPLIAVQADEFISDRENFI